MNSIFHGYSGPRAEPLEGGVVDYYVADVVSQSDYYPFGMLLPNRNDPGDNDYRYGFNGMEDDEEMTDANGQSYDFGARMYNPRIVRFFSRDPRQKDYPFYSPYLFARNNPILMIDVNGEYGWPTTAQWSYEHVIGYQNFVQTEIARIKAEAVEAGYADGNHCDDSENPDFCFDCADFGLSLLIRYAAENGLEVEVTLEDGQVINSGLTDEFVNSELGTITIDGIESFEDRARGFSDAESLISDMTPVGSDELIIGDVTNTTGHVQVITDPDASDGFVGVQQGNLPAVIPDGRTIYENYYTNYFYRWNVIDEGMQDKFIEKIPTLEIKPIPIPSSTTSMPTNNTGSSSSGESLAEPTEVIKPK